MPTAVPALLMLLLLAACGGGGSGGGGNQTVEPAAPPPDPGPPPRSTCMASTLGDMPPPEDERYPEPALGFQPACREISRDMEGWVPELDEAEPAEITLRHRERLADAIERLYDVSGEAGGVINIPWNVDTVQCDTHAWRESRRQRLFVLRGLLGPNGEKPRFYCRATKKGGTVEAGLGTFANYSMSSTTSKAVWPHNIVWENLEIDGYGSHARAVTSGRMTIRNVYAHHATNDGFSSSGITPRYHRTGFGNSRIVWSESWLSHSGQGNTKHAVYLHGCTDQPWNPDWECGPVTAVVENSTFHDCATSSCFKSTADVHRIRNSRFARHRATDPAFGRAEGSMMVDIIACADNVIEGNEFIMNRAADARRTPDGAAVGIRNRRGMAGCNKPQSYYQPDPDGDRYRWERREQSEFWSADYWRDLSGEHIFRTRLSNNLFDASESEQASATAFVTFGTYPNVVMQKFSTRQCLLATPEGWYERHRSYAEGNTVIGFSSEYRSVPPDHDTANCSNDPGTDRRDFDMIEFGPAD